MALNIWRRFGDLIRPPHQEIVTVTRIVGAGVIEASTVGGGTVRLRCGIEVAPGDKVFAAGSEAKSKAASLPYYELEI